MNPKYYALLFRETSSQKWITHFNICPADLVVGMKILKIE
jgi:hypothetical protein